MQSTTLSFRSIHLHGELFANMFRARKRTFIEEKGWDLPQADDMEFDQYDTPMSRWVTIHEGDQVLAGVRLTPTTARCGVYSYMIRDAQRDLLDGSIPKDILDAPAPIDPKTWEASRLFVSHDIPQADRRQVQMRLTHEMTRSAREQGADRLICLTPASWPRWIRPCGLDAHAMGPKVWIGDGWFQCVRIELASEPSC
ncbi:acyl-homoserine-lactone synthase [Paracoccus sp. ME4]|uniref:acyl-homoserine-lactone synthase n=1 Tax=Paracoccus sp. ME4 TaxID=3138066 RepID=UPI00398A581A